MSGKRRSYCSSCILISITLIILVLKSLVSISLSLNDRTTCNDVDIKDYGYGTAISSVTACITGQSPGSTFGSVSVSGDMPDFYGCPLSSSPGIIIGGWSICTEYLGCIEKVETTDFYRFEQFPSGWVGASLGGESIACGIPGGVEAGIGAYAHTIAWYKGVCGG